MMQVRILPHLCLPGAAQMALDEALLESVSARPDAAVLRTYEWAEPTLSLGYFQTVASAEADPRWRGVPLVRRSTGGGAIWHDRELTYTIVLPRSHSATRRPADLYRAVHGAIAAAFESFGVILRPRGESGSENASGRPFLCFTDHDPEDMVLESVKIVGSAQRRRPGSVLQHGSILLARSPRTPELPGLAELVDYPPSVSSLSSRLTTLIPARLDLDPSADDVAVEERRLASDLETSVHRSPDWIRKR